MIQSTGLFLLNNCMEHLFLSNLRTIQRIMAFIVLRASGFMTGWNDHGLFGMLNSAGQPPSNRKDPNKNNPE
jgi:hypothetical protein